MSKANKTITEKRLELAELLAWFESEDFEIEKAIEKFNQARVIAEQIETELMEYKNQITVLKQQFDKE